MKQDRNAVDLFGCSQIGEARHPHWLTGSLSLTRTATVSEASMLEGNSNT
jgi:hypothetical protein